MRFVYTNQFKPFIFWPLNFSCSKNLFKNNNKRKQTITFSVNSHFYLTFCSNRKMHLRTFLLMSWKKPIIEYGPEICKFVFKYIPSIAFLSKLSTFAFLYAFGLFRSVRNLKWYEMVLSKIWNIHKKKFERFLMRNEPLCCKGFQHWFIIKDTVD